MYNRYVPQPDGSYARNRMPDPHPPRQKAAPSPPPQQEHDSCPKDHRPQEIEPPRRSQQHPVSFLKQLLPKDFDTGDLIVILLLLLMAGDSEEDRNNAILTIALYFLM